MSCKFSTDDLSFPLFFPCSDVALVTSLRDGMNLVSYEFVACQDAKKGVLILSEVITKFLHVWLCVIIIFFSDHSLVLNYCFVEVEIR
jgi:hypothetical protein